VGHVGALARLQRASCWRASGPLRYRADLRTCFYALFLFPFVPLSQYAYPSLLGWLLPLGLYCGFCAGVLTHNQNHRPTFVPGWANVWYQAWLSIFYGFPTFGWVPSHNQNHHKFVNKAGDASITWRYSKRNTWTIAWTYFFVSTYFQDKSIREYIRKAYDSKPELFRQIVLQYVTVIAAQVAMATLAIFLHGWKLGSIVYGVAFLAPCLFSLWSMFFINYVQHVDCDPWSELDHSRNFVGALSNWLVFNAGLHAAHHGQAGLHWSLLPEAHARIASDIHPELKQPSIAWFLWRTYVLGAFSDRLRTRQIGRPAWENPDGVDLDLTIPSIDTTGVGVNASRA
jgi:beta-carotene hydroxylase